MTTISPSATARPSRVILASAGTGKTYQLTTQFIRLMAGANGAAPESILATTFTRKAAGEIFDRLIRRLLAASAGDAEAARALAGLRDAVGAELDADACVAMLGRIADRLHRLHIRTIDSFFVQAALAYALEIDLTPGWRIVEDDEDARIRTEAIDRVLEEGDRAELIDLVRLLHGGHMARSVHDALLRAVDRAYPVFLQSRTVPGAWACAAPQRAPLAPESLRAAIERLREIELPTTKGGDTNKVWHKAHARDVEHALDDDWDAFLESGLAERVLQGQNSYASNPITPEVASAYRTLIDHASSLALDNLDKRNRATFRLLDAFDREYWKIKRERAAFRFDDIPRLLLDRQEDRGLDDLYYRIDGRVSHLLLDEFQDTSVTQFRLLEPIIDELLADPSDGRSVFCVGDVKQSLYAWRDAEPALLQRLPERWPQIGEPETLELSYRSSPIILETLNAAFGDLTANAAVAPPRAAAEWARRFRTHEPAPPKADLPGEAALLVGPHVDGDADARRRATLHYAAQRVAAIRRRSASASVGILVRKRRHIPRLIKALRDLEIDASEEGGNPVTDDPGVAAATSLLWLADHPGDTACAYHVATSPLGAVVGLTDARDAGAVHRLAAELRRRLSRRGYARTLASILHDASPSLDERGFARFCQLIELAQHFDEHAGTRPSEFVRLTRARGVEEPGRKPVRVMTVHNAKGLEFDAVVLPDLEDRWALDAADMLVERAGPLEPITGVSLYARSGLRDMSPRLRQMHDDRLAREVEEALCVLYVAMSRAVYHLEMIIEPSERLDARCSGAAVLREALAPGKPADERTTLWSRRSGDDWAEHLNRNARQRHHTELEPVELTLRRPAGVRAQRLQRRAPSAMEGARTFDLADALRLPAGAGALERGTLLHAWFEAIEWLDDAPQPSHRMLLDRAQELAIDEAAAKQLIREFEAALASESVRRILTRAHYESRRAPGDRLEVRREHPFAVRDRDDEGTPWLLSGVFDRLVVGRDEGGRPAWAHVVDFKTDSIDPHDMLALAERTAFYRPQIEAYRRAAAGSLRLPPDRVGATICFTSCDTAIDMDPEPDEEVGERDVAGGSAG